MANPKPIIDIYLPMETVRNTEKETDRRIAQYCNDTEGNFKQEDIQAMADDGENAVIQVIANHAAKQIIDWQGEFCTEHYMGKHSVRRFRCTSCRKNLVALVEGKVTK